MNFRKVSFEQNISRNLDQQNSIIPTPKKQSPLIKPDFSPILEKQNQLSYKKYGSYKKPQFREPEAPIKSPNFKTSAKIEGRNLFGAGLEGGLGEMNFFKKLNFDDCIDEKNNFLGKKNLGNELNNGFINGNNKNVKNKFNMLLEKCEEEDEDDFNLSENKVLAPTQSSGLDTEEDDRFLQSYKKEINNHTKNKSIRKCSINIEINKEILKTGKFEEEFIPLKTVKPGKFSTIFKVQNIKNKNIYCIKKIVKTSPKSNINNLKKITTDFKNNLNNILSQFCVQNLDYWIEKEEFKVELSELNYSNKNLYLLTDFYDNGDILDYLSKLENNGYHFSQDFYWDIIFEMMMGLLFVHECGYLHIDIQPGNYLVDLNGYIKLNDFGYALRLKELQLLDDIVEGDSRYISKELFHFSKNAKINEKSDVFSLGLTIFELLAKIDLPFNGELWHKLRDENFKITEKFLENCNIKENKEFIVLISQMIFPFDKRPNLKELINYFPQLKKRYDKLLLDGKYQKTCEINKNEGI